ncbi:MAG TPA: nucleotide exchange factor GrpE [Chloroflexi bacterium]|nr:nucleotide exchange factor GrpE [Chloroflexota bacterium]
MTRKKEQATNMKSDKTEENLAEQDIPIEGEVLEGEVIAQEESDEKDLIQQMKVENEKLISALEAEREQSEQYLKNWQYSQAELLNYKKRIEKDQQAHREWVKADSLQLYIDILDDIELALKTAAKDANATEWSKGIELIQRKMLGVLEKEGVTRIETDNGFDPMVHEAVSSEPHPAYESGEIIEVLQHGYCINNRTLRPARVRVAI